MNILGVEENSERLTISAFKTAETGNRVVILKKGHTLVAQRRKLAVALRLLAKRIEDDNA